MSRVVRRNCLIPVFSETAIQISGTSTPSKSKVTIDCFTRIFSKDWRGCLARAPLEGKYLRAQFRANNSPYGKEQDEFSRCQSAGLDLEPRFRVRYVGAG